jgi:hypothetical protein
MSLTSYDTALAMLRDFCCKIQVFLCVSGAVPRSHPLLVSIGIRVEDWLPTSPIPGLGTSRSTDSGSLEFTVAVFGR